MRTRQLLSLTCACVMLAGCQTGKQPFVAHNGVAKTTVEASQASASGVTPVAYQQPQGSDQPQSSELTVVEPPPNATADRQESSVDTPEAITGEPVTPLPPPATTDTAPELTTPPPTLDALASSVRLHFPMIQSAIASRTIASGETLSAWGAFDRKLEAESHSQPLDFYENYRQGIGIKRDTYWGGQTFAGYRIGRGIYEPWYLERETNKGGEFKAGFVVPLVRDRTIDANRAELWRAQLERGRVEPEIRALVLLTIRDAKVAYWNWIAAAANYEIAEGVLQLGLDRIGYLERQVDRGEKAAIDLVDNRRVVLSRQAKLQDAQRKLDQSAAKLSLFLRDASGRPVVLSGDQALDFPGASSPESWGESADIAAALANRPELAELQVIQRQLNIALRQACNETLPEIDAGLLVAQDLGEPTSSKRDKSEFEVEASLMVSVPLERRKAFGKVRQLRGKLAQVRAKTRFAADKISIEAQAAYAALVTAAQRVSQTSESLELARQMQVAERRLYELGQSTLFNLNLREKQTADAAVERVGALFDYHSARAAYAAALGAESLDVPSLETPAAELEQPQPAAK